MVGRRAGVHGILVVVDPDARIHDAVEYFWSSTRTTSERPAKIAKDDNVPISDPHARVDRAIDRGASLKAGVERHVDRVTATHEGQTNAILALRGLQLPPKRNWGGRADVGWRDLEGVEARH